MIVEWTYSSGIYTVEGTFTTSETSGVIDETDVVSHVYTVFENTTPLYTIDLVSGGITAFDAGSTDVFSNWHDFQYDIGSVQFSEVNTNTYPTISDYPVDFTLETVLLDNYTGLSFEVSSDTWYLERDGVTLTESYGFASGPVVTMIPIPSAVLLFGSGLAGLVGLGRRLKAKTL